MRKYTQREVELFFANAGYTLTGNYVNIKEKVAYSCDKGHSHSITFDNFKSGRRCPSCAIDNASKRYRHDYAYVKERFEKAGCRLLSIEYRNGGVPLDYICNCGNTAKIRFNDFKRGRRCNQCGLIKRFDTLRKNGLVPTSSQQVYIHNLIGGELNYPFGTLS